ncbi:hypothetical protein AB0H34_25195 [Saccharopolyspora shandongensis]|uniref:hypothetical protein n=1 Tax=Saccharopolyspora shandongensis TaxID=418495 RepID=UPI0033CFAC0B
MNAIATPSPQYVRRALLWLVITTAAYFLLNGAQIFETFTVVPSWTTAPPASLAVFHGPYGLDFQAFWIIFHSVHELTFLVAIAVAWKLPAVRRWLLVLLAAHIALRIWTVAYFAPTLIWFQSLPATAVPDDALRDQAMMWAGLNYPRVAGFLIISFALLPLIARLVRMPGTVRPVPAVSAA